MNVITIFVLLLLILTGQAESMEVSVRAVRSDGVFKGINRQNVDITLYGVEGRSLYKLAENFYIYGEASFTAPVDSTKFMDGIAEYAIKPYIAKTELTITLEGDDTVMFMVGPAFRYTHIDFEAIVPGTSKHGNGKGYIENWFVAQSLRFRGRSGPHWIELIGKVYIPISWQIKSKTKVYDGEVLVEERIEEEHGPGDIGGKIEITYRYKTFTVSVGYEYTPITNKTGTNLFTTGLGITF